MKNQKLCSGIGQDFTTRYGKHAAYNSITISDILSMVVTTTSVAKEKAVWFIPSTLHTREAEKQRENGAYYAIWCDIDTHTELDAIKDVLAPLDCHYIVYSSSRAKPEIKKWRVIIPLSEPATATQWQQVTSIINDKFQAANIEPDRASERVNQLCYLPNRDPVESKFYDRYINQKAPINWSVALKTELLEKENKAIAEQQRLDQQREQSRLKAVARLSSGTKSPIDAFNYAYPIEQSLEFYGYKRVGNKWISPNSESGNAGVTVKSDKWFSSHASDSDIGALRDGCSFGDAFDLFQYYEHGNNRNAALKAAGDMFTTDSGKTINQQNQQNYMEQQSAANATNDFNVIDNDFSQPVVFVNAPAANSDFSLKQFSITNQLNEMKTRMLDDVFVLDGIAIAGQLTVIYAKPNTGKTLLTLRMLVDSIKAGRIKGENVYYINADDSFKGLITKGEVANQYGFNMIAPAHNGFKVAEFNGYLQQLISNDTARGAIVVLDTLKKFTDLMDKKQGSDFMKLAREFSLSGGTVIMLAHTNKNRDASGKVVAGGTSDITDDCDCAYTLDEVQDSKSLGRTRKDVLFENFKMRGNVETELLVSYSIDKSALAGYHDLLDSVQFAGNGDIEKAKKDRDAATKASEDEAAINAIIDAIEQGNCKRLEIVAYVTKAWGISRRKVNDTLDGYTGTKKSNSSFWRVDNSSTAKIYHLLKPENVSPDDYEMAKNG